MEFLTQPIELEVIKSRTDYIKRDAAADIVNSLMLAADGDPIAARWLLLVAIAMGLTQIEH